MTRKLDIENTLDRSLRKQVSLPRLDGRFNAAVWRQIAAAKKFAPATARPARASRWLMVSNVLGIAVSAALVLYFVVSSLSGLQIALDLPVPPLPTPAFVTDEKLLGLMLWSFTIAAMVFAFSFTGMGRRLRQMLRAEFA